MADDSPVIQPPTLTVTQHQLLAAEFSAALDKVAALFPKPDPTLAVTKSFVRVRLSVPIEFLATAIVCVEQTPALRNVRLDPRAGRDTLQLFEAFRPVIDKVDRFKRDVLQSLNVQIALLTEDALQIYGCAQTLARDEKSPTLTAFVENMRRDLGRAEVQRKAAAAKKAADKADKAAAEKAAAEKAAAEKAAAEKAAPPTRAS
jgi:hypothetical protein